MKNRSTISSHTTAKIGLLFLFSLLLLFSPSSLAENTYPEKYTFSEQELSAIENIQATITKAGEQSEGMFDTVDFREKYRNLLNKQTSESKKRILLQVYIEQDYTFMERKGYYFIDHMDVPSLQLLNKQYRKDNNHVYYIGYLQHAEIFDYDAELFHTLENADVATFQTYDSKHLVKNLTSSYNYQHGISFEGTELYVEYAKDKNAVYSNGLPISKADPATYEPLPWGVFAKDNKYVYFRNWYTEDAPYIPLAQVDSQTFEVLNRFYAKDKNAVYEVSNCGGGSGRETCLKRLENADSKTLTPIENASGMYGLYAVAYDKNVIYTSWGYKIPSNDWQNLAFLSTSYAKDSKNAYYLGDTYNAKMVSGADISSFVVTENYQVARDKTRTYTKGEIFPRGKEQFIYIHAPYYTDKEQKLIYFESGYNEFVSLNIPYSGFKVLSEIGGIPIFGLGVYHNQRYYYDKKIPSLEGKELRFLSGMDNVFTDGTIIYLQKNPSLLLLSGADTKTFKPFMYTGFDGYAYALENYYQDKKNLYRNNVKIEKINTSTFKKLSQGFYYDKVSYATDGTHIYANGKLLGQADPKTFAYYGGISRMDAGDKNTFYFEGSMIPKEYKNV